PPAPLPEIGKAPAPAHSFRRTALEAARSLSWADMDDDETLLAARAPRAALRGPSTSTPVPQKPPMPAAPRAGLLHLGSSGHETLRGARPASGAHPPLGGASEEK